jgi:hypothetical protein
MVSPKPVEWDVASAPFRLVWLQSNTILSGTGKIISSNISKASSFKKHPLWILLGDTDMQKLAEYQDKCYSFFAKTPLRR